MSNEVDLELGYFLFDGDDDDEEEENTVILAQQSLPCCNFH